MQSNTQTTHADHIKQHLAQHACVFTLVHGKDSQGNSMYFYLAVEADKWDAFKNAMQTEHFNARDYGVVLYSDSSAPTETVERTIEEYYGISLRDMGRIA